MLGELLFEAGRLREALKPLEGARQLYPKGTRGIQTRERLVKVLVALDQEAKAEEVRQELALLPTKMLNAYSPPVKATLVPADSVWRWLHPTDGMDPAESDADFHTTFFTAKFDADAWKSGKDSNDEGGGFGYGDDWFEGLDIGKPASKELGKSAYFRHRFTTGKEHSNLELRCQRDDGIIVYLDGKDVARDNMREGEEAYDLPAASVVSDETTVWRIPLVDLTLLPGEHILAISLHNTEKPSSDLRIGAITLVEMEERE